jgi:hypothetical protein
MSVRKTRLMPMPGGLSIKKGPVTKLLILSALLWVTTLSARALTIVHTRPGPPNGGNAYDSNFLSVTDSRFGAGRDSCSSTDV